MLYRFIIVLAALALSITGIAASCGGDDDNDDNSSSGPTYGPQNCDTGNDTDTGTGSNCSDSELNDYGDCVLAACDDDYKKCYGDNWKDGDFSGGDCEDYIDCYDKCTCDNVSTCGNDCAAQYMTMTSPCFTCMMSNLSTCGNSCELPDCMTQ
jgi:hypothetical protein